LEELGGAHAAVGDDSGLNPRSSVLTKPGRNYRERG